MYIVFDTETNGLPKSWKAPKTDVDNWPRVTQLAWQVYDEEGTLIRENCTLIKPDGWTIPTVEELKANGSNKDPYFFENNNMSTERCEREGHRMIDVLEDFVEQVNNDGEYLIAHNMNFDDNVIGAEMIRYGLSFAPEPKRLCTMKETIGFCRMPPFRYGSYKFPTLTELHTKLFDEGFDGAHDALADVKACAKSFFELKKRKVMLG